MGEPMGLRGSEMEVDFIKELCYLPMVRAGSCSRVHHGACEGEAWNLLFRRISGVYHP